MSDVCTYPVGEELEDVLENKVWKIHPVCEGVLLLSNASALKFLLPQPPLSLLTVLKILLVFLLDDIGRFLLVITKLYWRNTNNVLGGHQHSHLKIHQV